MICDSSISSTMSLHRRDVSVGLCVTSHVSRRGRLLLAQNANMYVFSENKCWIYVTLAIGSAKSLVLRNSDGSWKGQRKRRVARNLWREALKKPVLNYRRCHSPNTSQYIMHTAIFQNVWITAGAFLSMAYRSHIMGYVWACGMMQTIIYTPSWSIF